MEATVTEKDNGRRLDLVLKFLLPSMSRSAVKKLLNQGKVMVNGQVEYRPNYTVSQGEVMKVEKDVSLERESLVPYKKSITLAYQDQNIVIADKPAGLKVHPTKTNEIESLINALYYNLQAELTDYGVTLVNRIDKPTSGLVVAALTPRGAWHYAKQFKNNKANKEYLAVVYGNWISKFGYEEVEVHNFLQHNHLAKKQIVDKEKGVFSHTKFKAVSYNKDKNFTLLLVKPVTGRTHQIRVHLEWLGFPIVGDKKYGGQDYTRLLLHSYRIRLRNLKDEVIDVTSEIPDAFSELFTDHS